MASSPQFSWLSGVWGTSGTNVFAVGDGGRILNYNGSSWYATSGTTISPYDAWGSSGTDIFAVGWGVIHYNGRSWSEMISELTQEQTLNGVWGSSGTDVFAAGFNGNILHYNGSSWSPMTSGTTNTLRDIWGTSGTDVFAVGDYGTILHYGGSTWTPMISSNMTRDNLTSIWGSSGRDVFAIGAYDTILHYSCEGTGPTLITLSSFTATPSKRSVILKWTTASEIDNSGFNLYRAESENGEYVKINDSLIPTKGSSTSGAEYQYVDKNVKSKTTYYYKLEDIDLSGKSTMHGPISVEWKRVRELGVME
jgi:hypothetical protein